jgi:uncharacterized protein YidB (DUF937 family)
MGLIDILNGMQNGPRGQKQPAPPGKAGSGGMLPLMMALLALLAYKGMKGFGQSQTAPAGGQRPSLPPGGGQQPSLPPGGSSTANAPGGGLGDLLGGLLGGKPGTPGAGAGGGGLGDLLGGMLGGQKPGAAKAGSGDLGSILGGLLGGAAAGGLLNGGLDSILKDLARSGHGQAAQSWIGTGPNQSISPHDLESALGADTLDELSRRTGLSRSDLLSGFSEQLPELVDQLTPNGRLPTEQEAARWV